MPAPSFASASASAEQTHTPRVAPEVQTSTLEEVELMAAEESRIDAEVERQRIRVLSGSTDTAASFQIDGEDHTFGNALRYVIMKNPDVEFCGYSIPHPSENKLNIRIQTYNDVSVYTIFDKALNDLEDICDIVLDKFDEAVEQKGGAEVDMEDA